MTITSCVIIMILCVRVNASMVPCLTLNNGLSIPAIAVGTYLGFGEQGIVQSIDKQLRNVIMSGIDIGVRNFDTASVYTTEAEVGEGVRLKIEEGRVRREDIFITTKLWNDKHQVADVEPALRESLGKLGLEYVDLYLMHWPMGINANGSYSEVDYLETWRAMEAVYKKGLAKSIGVSNFNEKQLNRLLENCEIKPAVLQTEIHTQLIQKDLVNFAQNHSIVVMGYSPLGSLVSRHGAEKNGIHSDNPVIVDIANKYGKTPAQIVLRWQVDRNIIPIPKSIKLEHLQSNMDIFNFKLTKGEISKINEFDAGVRYNLPSFWQNHTYYPFDKIENPLTNPF